MLVHKRLFAWATVAVIYACLPTVAKAQGNSMQGVPGFAHRQKCLEVGCAPQRGTYNYYPTTWRRWPTEMLVPSPTPAAEQVTTPMQAPSDTQLPDEQPPAGRIEPDQPTITPDEATPLPPETEAAPAESRPPTTEPKLPPDSGLPFEDRPPELPSDTRREPGPSEVLPAPSEPSPTTPESPAPTQLPPSDDAPPTMPDDDPFKDDPPHPGPEPETPGGKASDQQTSRSAPATERGASSMALEWRSAGTPGIPVEGVAPVTRLAAGQEPVLLPPGDAPAKHDHATLPATATARQNPLRLAIVGDRDAAVVPTAAWTAEKSRPVAVGASSRRNPLRDN